ncbi:MAG: hypothetical protein IJ594_01890, partial [Oscillospiraceae bacterium]|nr:hypothetical protein [Oscillospiraceae bacterium]
MKRRLKRALCLFLAVLMMTSMLPAAYAAEGGTDDAELTVFTEPETAAPEAPEAEDAAEAAEPAEEPEAPADEPEEPAAP